MDLDLLQRAPVALFMADAAGTCTFATDELCRQLAVDRVALVGRPWREVLEAADVDLVSVARAGAIGVLERGPIVDLVALAAEHDELTGLLSRSAVVRYLRKSLDEVAEGVGPISVGVLLCRLHEISDVQGLAPDALDELIGAVAGRLRGAVRFCDAVGRIDDDCFVVLAEQEDDPSAIEHVAERLVELIDRPFRLRGGSARISGGIGVAVGDATTSADDLLASAMQAADEASAEGTTCWRRAEGLRVVH